MILSHNSKLTNSLIIANLQYPFKAIRGALALGSGYYARMLDGQCVIQRKPNRKNHIPTPNETANQQRFIAQYRKKNTRSPPEARLKFATTSRPHAANGSLTDP